MESFDWDEFNKAARNPWKALESSRMMKKCRKKCSKLCDPFGHHAHVCDAINKILDHNHARDIVKSMGGAIGFIADT